MPHGLVVETFYRVLFYEVGPVGGPPAPHHMILNWNAGTFIGYHLDHHPQWATIWNQTQSTDWLAYPLYFSHGLYAAEAIRAYIAAAQANGGLNGWTDTEKRESKLLVGVPAFRCPLGAAKYAEQAPIPPLIATFEGVFVWCLPEEKDTGVQAHVIKPTGKPVPLAEFRESHRIAPVQPEAGAAEGGDIELPFVDG